jgi:hypothetical protein
MKIRHDGEDRVEVEAGIFEVAVAFSSSGMGKKLVICSASFLNSLPLEEDVHTREDVLLMLAAVIADRRKHRNHSQVSSEHLEEVSREELLRFRQLAYDLVDETHQSFVAIAHRLAEEVRKLVVD